MSTSRSIGVAVGAVAAGLAGAVAWRTARLESPARPTPHRVDVAARPGIGDRLARLIAIPTVSDAGDAVFDGFVALLREEYPLVFSRLEVEEPSDRSLLLRWAGSDPLAQPIVLMAHYDVVPVVEADWSRPPFGETVRDGVVWGRGALDDKGELVVLLEAIENLLAAGVTPGCDVYLALGGNEETYGSGAVATAQLLASRGIRAAFVLDEGGAVIDSPFPGVDAPLAVIGTAEKGILSIRLSVAGEGGHASTPPRWTAIDRLARALRRVRSAPAKLGLSEPARQMLEAIAPHSTGPLRAVFGNLWLFGPLVARVLPMMGPENAGFVQTTVAPTMLGAGTAANVLPSAAEATLNLRLVPGDTVEATVGRLRRLVRDEQVQVQVLEGDDPTPVSPADNSAFAQIAAAVAVSWPEAVPVPYLMMQATDSRHFHGVADAVYRFAPLKMTSGQRASIHGIDEFVEVESLERGERFYRQLIAGNTPGTREG
jgi:carboxypeptidase PM20D1